MFGDDEISGTANVFDNDFVDNQMEVQEDTAMSSDPPRLLQQVVLED